MSRRDGPKGLLWTPFLWFGRRLFDHMAVVIPLAEDLSSAQAQDAPQGAMETPPAHPPALPLCVRQARRLGLELDTKSGVASRWGEGLTVRGELRDEELWGDLLGIRLALDAPHTGWSVAAERQALPQAVYQKHEIPSPYGERMPWVVPSQSVARWEAQTQGVAVRGEHGLGAGVEVVFVLEMGRCWHVLGEQDLGALGWSLAKVQHDAIRALFYASYKVRPAKTYESEHGVIRVYETTEGLGATRMLLLPDFDFDAARAGGWAMVASRDQLLVVEPAAGVEAAAAGSWLEEVAAGLRAQALFPMRECRLRLDARETLRMQ